MDRAQSFTVVSGSRFTCITYGIPTLEEDALLSHTRITAERAKTFDPTVGSRSYFLL
jgi:hypothetical protein